MPTNFFTNENENTLLNKIVGITTNQNNLTNFDTLVGYFRASGYFKLSPLLEKYNKIRILVGIDVDKLTEQNYRRGLEFIGDSGFTKKEYFEELINEIRNANYSKEIEEGIISFLQDVTSKRIELRAHPSKKIHAKIYIFTPDNFNQHSSGYVITGSSNLTAMGLGINENSNYEFNVGLSNYDDVIFAKEEFEKLWSESTEVLKSNDSDNILKQTHLNDDTSPFAIYIKMLIKYFGESIEYDPYNIETMLPKGYSKYKYQTDAANQGYGILMKHNGVLLADVVGLGKTIIALMIAKKFVYENGSKTKILVVIPPAIRESWKETIENFQLDNNFHLINNGSIHKVLDEDARRGTEYNKPEMYDMIIIDESHKFRNDYTDMYSNLQLLCNSARISRGHNNDTKKKVILMSATPLNNKPSDIKNQLYLFQNRRKSTIEGITNLENYFSNIEKKYDTIRKLEKKFISDPSTKEKYFKDLKLLYSKLKDDIIEPLVIRRTRNDLEKSSIYLSDINEQKLKFPKVEEPIAEKYEMPEALAKVFLNTIKMITGIDENGLYELEDGSPAVSDRIDFYRYRAIEFLKDDENKKIYGKSGKDTDNKAKALAHIMKTLLVKRLESSFFAFKKSLSKYKRAVENMILMFEKDTVFIAPDFDVNDLIEDDISFEEIEEKINKKGDRNIVFKKEDFKDEFFEFLKAESEKLSELNNAWKIVDTGDELTQEEREILLKEHNIKKRIEDPKMKLFLTNIQYDFFNEKNKNQKLVIFTESTDTSNYILNKIESSKKTKDFKGKILCISSKNRKENEGLIKHNFDANSKIEENNYSIIVTTDVLAEGINLHRSNIIINFDVPWNSTRLMQRIGRVNRIGTKADFIYIYNYYPSARGDAQINLVNTAIRKLQSFHIAFGSDHKILSDIEQVDKDGQPLYGAKIEKEESEILKYLDWLRKFKETNPDDFEKYSNLPNKSRCGRKIDNLTDIDKIESTNFEITSLPKSTLTYLEGENGQRAFCFVSNKGNRTFMTFLDAVRLFQANKEEKSIELHEKHFDQVNLALAYFKSESIFEVLKNEKQTVQLSPIDKKAINIISAILKNQKLPVWQKEALINAKKTIQVGVYRSALFSKKVKDFYEKNIQLATSLSTQLEFANKLFDEVLNEFNLGNSNVDVAEKDVILNPSVVLSNSYDE